MPSTCPRCREIVSEDVVCCADIVYTWRCKHCRKVSTGFAIPYGKCFMCGGSLERLPERNITDPMRIRPIRDAVQFELNTYHFYRLALTRAIDPTLRAVFEQLYQNEVDHLHTLQARYHTHLNEEVLDLRPEEDALLSSDLFRGIDMTDPKGGPLALYERAIEMEKRTRDHFRRLAMDLPEGPEREICLELAAEEEEHAALLETEREQFIVR
jgi:glutamate synthase (NADPH) small chain